MPTEPQPGLMPIFPLSRQVSSSIHSRGLCWPPRLGHLYEGVRPSWSQTWCRGPHRMSGALGQWIVVHYLIRSCLAARTCRRCSSKQNFGRFWLIWALGVRPLSISWSSPLQPTGVSSDLCQVRKSRWCSFPIWQTVRVTSCCGVLLVLSGVGGRILDISSISLRTLHKTLDGRPIVSYLNGRPIVSYSDDLDRHDSVRSDYRKLHHGFLASLLLVRQRSGVPLLS